MREKVLNNGQIRDILTVDSDSAAPTNAMWQKNPRNCEEERHETFSHPSIANVAESIL